VKDFERAVCSSCTNKDKMAGSKKDLPYQDLITLRAGCIWATPKARTDSALVLCCVWVPHRSAKGGESFVAHPKRVRASERTSGGDLIDNIPPGAHPPRRIRSGWVTGAEANQDLTQQSVQFCGSAFRVPSGARNEKPDILHVLDRPGCRVFPSLSLRSLSLRSLRFAQGVGSAPTGSFRTRPTSPRPTEKATPPSGRAGGYGPRGPARTTRRSTSNQ